MSAYSVLGEAHRLIFNANAWSSGALARDVQGREVDPLHPDAVRWCALGAVRRAAATFKAPWDDYDKALTFLQDAFNGPVTAVQDGSSHAQVLEAFEKARMEALNEARSNASS